MYKIMCSDESVKIHFASTENVAIEIMNDLESRFGKCTIIEEASNEVTWDPGGMMMMNDEVFSFPLGDITVECKAQHFNFMVGHIQYYKPRGEGTQYIKIHGHWTCICLTIEEFEQLNNLINDSSLTLRAERSYEKRAGKLRKLNDDGHVLSVIKDKDGNLYKAPKSDAPIDKKLLN